MTWGNLAQIFFKTISSCVLVYIPSGSWSWLFFYSIISGRFWVCSVTIHHILKSSGNTNIVGSIRHVSCFHLERYDKMIKIVYYVIHINFPIKSIDSCWLLKRGQHEIYRKIYWITKYSKKVWLEKNLNKKYSCWLRKIKMSGKSSPEFQWTDDEIQLLLEATQNLKVEEDYKKITRFYPRPTVIYVLVFLHSVVSFYKKLSFLYQTLLNLH